MTRVSGMTEMNRIDRMTTMWHKIYFSFLRAIFPAIRKNKLTWITGMTGLIRMNRTTTD